VLPFVKLKNPTDVYLLFSKERFQIHPGVPLEKEGDIVVKMRKNKISPSPSLQKRGVPAFLSYFPL